MLFVANCDIDGLCQHGQIFTEAQMDKILWEVDFVDCVACATEYAAECWAATILEGVAK
jgi:hypothetical protein